VNPIERRNRVRARLQDLDMAIETADRRGHDVPILGEEIPGPRGASQECHEVVELLHPEPSSLSPGAGLPASRVQSPCGQLSSGKIGW